MFHVATRKRLALAAVAVFLVISGAFVYVVGRDYSPAALQERARAAVRKATAYEVALGKTSVSVDNSVTFADAAVVWEGRQLLLSGPITVRGLPNMRDVWEPSVIEIARPTLILDLSDRDGVVGAITALARLAGAAARLPVHLADDLAIELAYGQDNALELDAMASQFLEKGGITAAPHGVAEADFKLVIAPDEVTLDAVIDPDQGGIVKALAQKACGKLFEKTPGPVRGRLAARWNAETATVTLSNSDGWKLDPSAAFPEAHTAGGSLDVVVTTCSTRDDQVESAQGTVAFAAPVVRTELLSRWLALVSIKALDNAGNATEFENVHIAADFRLSGGELVVKPLADKPALVWSEVDGHDIVLFTGEGRTSFASFLAAVESSRASN